MALVSVKCTNCGGEIQLDENREFGYCSSCGSKVMVEQSITNIKQLNGNVIVDGNVQIIDSREKIERETKMKRIKITFEKAKTGRYWEAEKDIDSYEVLYEAEIGVDGTRRMGYGLIQKLCTDIINVNPEDDEAYFYRVVLQFGSQDFQRWRRKTSIAEHLNSYPLCGKLICARFVQNEKVLVDLACSPKSELKGMLVTS